MPVNGHTRRRHHAGSPALPSRGLSRGLRVAAEPRTESRVSAVNSCPHGHTGPPSPVSAPTRRPPRPNASSWPDREYLTPTPGLSPALAGVSTAVRATPLKEEDHMRKLTIPCLVAAFVAGACGDKHPRSGDANAAEVTTASPESASVTAPTSPSATGPVSFADAKAAYAGKRYDESVRLLTTYTTEHPDNVWGYYMLGLSA